MAISGDNSSHRSGVWSGRRGQNVCQISVVVKSRDDSVLQRQVEAAAEWNDKLQNCEATLHKL